MTFRQLAQPTTDMTAIPKGKRVILSQNHTRRLAQSVPKGQSVDPRIQVDEIPSFTQSFDKKFQRIVLDHQQSVRVFLARYVFCPQQIDDLAQEVFIVAHKQLRHFRRESKISTWLLGIARNKALGYLRSEVTRLRNQKQFAEANNIGCSLESLNQEIDSQANFERIDALNDCIDQLPKPSRQLVERFYFKNEPSSVIAAVTQQKDGTVRMKLKRIRIVLQKCIASKIH